MELVKDALIDGGVEMVDEDAPAKGHVLETVQHGDVYVKFGTGGQKATVELLRYECLALEHIRHKLKSASITRLHCPRPVFVGEITGDAFLAMEALVFSPGDTATQMFLGESLCAWHQHKCPPPTGSAVLRDFAPAAPWQDEASAARLFGFPLDGCCGAHPQSNNSEGRTMTWVEFWREHRLDAQLKSLRELYPEDTQVQELGAQLSSRLDELFGGAGMVVEDIVPTLLHGDLWSGNVGSVGGEPVMYDPAAYYGHYEAEMGIGAMFSSFPPAFHEEYQRKLVRELGFERRAMLYELHHHLNHYNIFGSSYRKGTMALIKSILKA